MHDLVYRSATSLVAAMAQRELTATAVMRAHLDHIARVDPALHAIVQLCADDALRAAHAADTSLASGQRPGCLHGLPFTAKDVIDVAGVVGAAGLPERATHRPAQDAEVVRRWKAAGAICIGKTNCPPGGAGGETSNPVYGATHNPYQPAHGPAGSSGGDAVAVAAGMAPLGLGSDSGGSLRVPAHCCGVATLKPTVGRVPNTGVLHHQGGLSDPRTQLGPLARCIDDLVLAWPVLAGPDGVDSGVVPMPLLDIASVDPRRLRVAVFADDGIVTPDSVTAQAVDSAAQALAAAGVAVQTAVPPGLADAWDITERFWAMESLRGDAVLKLFADWDAFRSRMLQFLRRFDAVLCPVAPGPAPRLGPVDTRFFHHTIAFSLCGWPGAVVRAGTHASGLPVGVQLSAGPWQEHTALVLAKLVEQAGGGWQIPPPG